MSTATILDVARTARVSAGTVSRVLNQHPSVSPDNSERVLKAIEALNYAPRQRKATMADLNPLEHKNVLLLMLGMDRSLASLPVVAAAMHGVEQAMNDARANLLIADVPGVDRVPDVLSRKRIDGVIIKGAMQGDLLKQADPALIERLRNLPAVWILGRPTGWEGDVVQVNDMLVGQIAAEHLTSRDHRRLAFISPKPTHTTLLRRQASFTFFAEQAGATVNAYLGDQQTWKFPSPAIDHVERVQSLVDKLLADHNPPTAIFAPDDSVGAMVARALAARGLQAGREISLMSCNNERPLLVGVYPTLTTIDVHAEEIGRRAVDQLAWRLSHHDQPWFDSGIEPTLVEGASVATVS
jgi:LacI family transcriptional regulator